MGFLVDGVWRDEWYDTEASDGRFVRRDSQFRNWITPDGRPGPTGEGGFPAEAGRYHLYVSHACPWAHRTTIFRTLKGLEDAVSMSVTHWLMAENGWTFAPGPGVVPDDVNGSTFLYQVYLADSPRYSGHATTPVLWDKARGKIVSNESSEIIRMLNVAFDGVGAHGVDYYPERLRRDIDALNGRIYDLLNNGVYKAGFATSQRAYEEAARGVFGMLDELEARLSGRRYLCDARPTEADWRLFTTLVRFDVVYVGHFKCNLRRLADYPALSAYARDLFQIPGVAQTVHFDHIKRHYYESHRHLNPSGVVPIGPALDFGTPHGRERLS